MWSWVDHTVEKLQFYQKNVLLIHGTILLQWNLSLSLLITCNVFGSVWIKLDHTPKFDLVRGRTHGLWIMNSTFHVLVMLVLTTEPSCTVESVSQGRGAKSCMYIFNHNIQETVWYLVLELALVVSVHVTEQASLCGCVYELHAGNMILYIAGSQVVIKDVCE